MTHHNSSTNLKTEEVEMLNRFLAAFAVVVLIAAFSSVSLSQDAMKKEMKKEDKPMLKHVSCEPDCGFMVRSHDEKEIVSMVKQHAKSAHNKEMSDKDVMAMMKGGDAMHHDKMEMKKDMMKKDEKK